MSSIATYTPECFEKIQKLSEQNKVFWEEVIRKPSAKKSLIMLMELVHEAAQNTLAKISQIPSGDFDTEVQLKKMLAPEVSQIANSIFLEMEKVQKGEEPYTRLDDRHQAYPKLHTLYTAHKTKDKMHNHTSWQEHALAIEQELVHQDPQPLNTLLHQIQALSEGEGFSQSRKVYLAYAWPSFELEHEQWTLPFLETLTQDLQRAGLLVSSKQMNKSFTCEESQSVLLVGTQSLVKDYEERDSEILQEIQAILKKRDAEKDSLVFPVKVLLLSGEANTSFPPQFLDIVHDTSPRKSYLIFLKELLEDLYSVPLSQSNPNRIRWEETWFLFWESVGSYAVIFKKGLDKQAVNYYAEKNKLLLTQTKKEREWASKHALSSVSIEGNPGVALMRYLKQTAPRKIQAPKSLKRFVGRKKELEKMWAYILDEDLTHEAQILLLHGRGGVGKSELATKFARDYAEEFSLVFTMQAGSHDLVQQGYLELATLLDLYIEKNDTHNTIVSKVHQRLADGLDRPWLLIFDNVIEPLDLPTQGGAIIATSQKKNLWPEIQEPIEVKEFGIQEAFDLFGNPKSSKDSYKTLFKKLEYLPLLLTQACRFIQDDCDVDEYLQLIEKEHPLWEKTNRYPHALSQTYQLTLRKIQSLSQEAYLFLQICAYLQPDRIHKDHLTAWLNSQGNTSLSSALSIRKVLIDWSLFGQNGDVFKMHRLLQQVLRKMNQQDKKAHFLQAFETINRGFSLYDPMEFVSWKYGLINALHIDFLHAQSLWKKCVASDDQIIALHSLITFYEVVNPDYQKSLGYAEQALGICRKALGENHPFTAEIYNCLSIVYSDLGDYHTALGYDKRALEIRQGMLGKKDLKTATSYDHLGKSYEKLGDYQKALKFKKKGLRARRKALGEDHATTAISYMSVGGAYEELGDYQQALKYKEKALHIAIQNQYEDDINTAYTYSNVAITYSELGQHRKALKYEKKSFKILKNRLGDNHLKLVVSYVNQGKYYSGLGQYRKALKCEKRALKGYRNALGDNHPNTANLYNSLGITYGRLKEHRKALIHAKKGLKIRRKVLGEKHPDTLSSYHNLANAYGDVGKYEQALKLMEKALNIKIQTLGKNHPKTANSYDDLGVAHGRLENYRKGLKFSNKALRIRRKTLGNNHADTAQSYNNIAMFHALLEDYSLALKYAKKALHIFNKVLEDQHPDLLDRNYNVGSLYVELGKSAKALPYFEKALEIGIEILGKNHPSLANIYADMSSASGKVGEYQKALEYSTKALKIHQESVLENDEFTATVYGSIGWYLTQLGKYKKGRKMCEKGLHLFHNILGDDYLKHSHWIIDTLALISLKLGFHSKALEYAEQALELADASGGSEREMAECFIRLASIQLAANHPDYLKNAKKALTLCLESFDEKHLETVAAYRVHGLALTKKRKMRGLKDLEKAIQISRDIQQTRRIELAESFYMMGLGCQFLKLHDRALENFQESLEIQQKDLPKNHPDIAETLHSIETIQARLVLL